MRPVLVAAAVFVAGFSIYLAEGALHVSASRRVGSSLPLGYSEAAVVAREVELRGEYRKGTNGTAVILLHGVGDSRRGMRGFAAWLSGEGYSVLAPDSRGHGVSGGNLISYGVRESEDVSRWLDWLEANDNPRAILGLGESMGASVLLQSLVDSRLRAVVAECAYSSFSQIASDRLVWMTRLPSIGRPLAWPFVGTALLYGRIRYGVDLADASPADAIRRSTAPVLLIHGLADDRTPPWHSRAIYDARPRATELWEVPGAHHVQASVVAPEEFRARIKHFFSGVLYSAASQP